MSIRTSIVDSRYIRIRASYSTLLHCQYQHIPTYMSVVCRSPPAVGRGELPGADGAAQDARPHVRPLRQLQRRRGGRLPRARRAAARLGPAVRQLVARGRPQGVLRAAAGRPGAAPHLPG